MISTLLVFQIILAIAIIITVLLQKRPILELFCNNTVIIIAIAKII